MNTKLRLAASIIIAISSILLMPLAALACGGLFTPGTPLDQNIERIIFAVAPGSMTVYEQINYSGSASQVPHAHAGACKLFGALAEAVASPDLSRLSWYG